MFEVKDFQRANQQIYDAQTSYGPAHISAQRKRNQTGPAGFVDDKVQEKIIVPELRPGQPRQKRTSRKTYKDEENNRYFGRH